MPNQNVSVISPQSDQSRSSTRSVVAGAKDAMLEVKEEASEVLHGARDVALETYDLAREALDHAAIVAEDAGGRTVSFVKRTSVATVKFVTLHPLPLAALGASLGWLFMSVRASGTTSSRTRRLGRNEVDRPLAHAALRATTKQRRLTGGRAMPLDVAGAVRELGAIELADRAADLTVLDPNQLYLHHSLVEQRSAQGRTSPERVPVVADSILGWYQRRSAFGRTVDEVIERLQYPGA